MKDDKPRYKHYCPDDTCVFLGHYTSEDVLYKGEYDLYACQGLFIARKSDVLNDFITCGTATEVIDTEYPPLVARERFYKER